MGKVFMSGIAPALTVPSITDPNTILLLHGEALEDSSQYSHLVTNSGVFIEASRGKFGGSSLGFNGTASLNIQSDLFNFGSGDFTFDWWEYCTGQTATRFALSINGGCGGLCAGGGGELNSLYISSNGTSSWDMVNGAVAFNKTASEWVHWAVVRSGNTIKTYRNGTVFWSGTISGSIYWNGAGLTIGSFLYDANHYFGGYIDEFRVSNIARWTENFTPPTEAYRR